MSLTLQDERSNTAAQPASAAHADLRWPQPRAHDPRSPELLGNRDLPVLSAQVRLPIRDRLARGNRLGKSGFRRRDP